LTNLAALQDRFLSSLVQLTDGDDRRVCLAVSGGTDSMAMLFLAHATVPDRCIAATVDHGLRAEAREEAAYVAEICGKLSIPHATLTVKDTITGNIQSQARELRYALLRAHALEKGAAWIATAHHSDDQVETFLMRLARGSGIDGLSSIRRRNEDIIRPFLDFSRDDLEQICLEHGVQPVQDPSNDDESFDRVRMRKWLRENDMPFDRHALQASAEALSEGAAALVWMTERLAEQHIDARGGEIMLDAQNLPNEMQRRLLLLALDRLQPGYTPRGEPLSRALQEVRGGGKAMLGELLITGGLQWRLTKAPPRRN